MQEAIQDLSERRLVSRLLPPEWQGLSSAGEGRGEEGEREGEEEGEGGTCLPSIPKEVALSHSIARWYPNRAV